jgi:hypothetical protein
MAGGMLTADATLTCPHGGKVVITPASPRAQGGGAPVATTADGFAIAGCTFTLPGPVPSPCVRVQWILPGQRVRRAGAQVLYADSTGLCLAATGLPQGKVTVQMTQTRATGG